MKLPNAKSITLYDSIAELSDAVAHRISASAQEAVAARGVFRIALAGGETPRHCYQRLRALPVEWDKVHIYFGDERCLPRGDAQRNDSMAYDSLLTHVGVPQGNIHAIPAELGAERAAAEYVAVLELPLDMVLLGMGEDGHTASLFPDNVATDSTAATTAVFKAPKPPAERVSLGMTVLNTAREKLFLVAGAGKRWALARIMRGELLPAARVTGAEWHMDRTACPEK